MPRQCHCKLNAASTACLYATGKAMIDYFTLALTHGLIAVALWRLLFRQELDQDGAPPRRGQSRWLRRGEAKREGADDA